MTQAVGYLPNLAEHPLWQNPFLHMLAAGWATQDDFTYFTPLLEHAKRIRNQTYQSIIARSTQESAALLHQAQSLGGFSTELARWPVADDTAPLPTYALYFEIQHQIQCQGDLASAYAHLFLLEYATDQIGTALQRAWDKKNQPDLQTPQTPQTQQTPQTEHKPAINAQLALRQAIKLSHYQLPDAVLESKLAILQRWFDDLYQGVRQNRTAQLINKIQAKRTLQTHPARSVSLEDSISHRVERDDKRQQDFSVARLPCDAQTLDPRIVRIAPGKFNNLHRHAHETLFCLIQGEGEILIGDAWVPVKTGQSVFAPRWVMHQTHNTGADELIMYAITDYYLSHQVFIGASSTTVLG